MIARFLIAVQFLTRVPVPQSHAATDEEIGEATAWFPAVGALVGGAGAVAFLGASQVLPVLPATVLLVAFLAWTTNAFHEDGLADAFDGFGGGWTRERTLEIMRDSRLGTYGALALVLLVLAKVALLSSLAWDQLWRWLVVAHAASRWTVLPLALWLPYAREEGQGKLVARRVGWRAFAVATATLVGAGLLLPPLVAVAALVVVLAVVGSSGRYYRARLGGVTGDCLGATNQLAEVALYAVAVALAGAWGV